ncbi:MAG: dihydroorotate dehydrogenase-like protein [Acidobacteria bacterium]|nr:MAG: dihydroorotate dehydrogenase-like protein [Acidobacteriota bacterium]
MKLTTSYLGLKLKNPFMPGASPLADRLDTVLDLEDAGASAIVMRSLFEEQLQGRRFAFMHAPKMDSDADVNTASYFPMVDEFALEPDTYLEQVRRIKARVSIPVIPSINGTTTERWLEYARLLPKAGADALELNFYHVATDCREDSAAVERRLLDVVAVLKETLAIPLAVKLSPFYSSLPNLAVRLETIGADGLVLFNRFYQPDIDPEELEATPTIALSSSGDLLLRLRWLAILAPIVRRSLGVSGGIHRPVDAVKAVMAGADAVQLVSALLQHGPRYLSYMVLAFNQWGSEHGYTTIDEMRDKMSLAQCADPQAFERGSYLRILQSWR